MSRCCSLSFPGLSMFWQHPLKTSRLMIEYSAYTYVLLILVYRVEDSWGNTWLWVLNINQFHYLCDLTALWKVIVSQILSFLLLGTMINWEDVLLLINGTHKKFDEIQRKDDVPSDSEIQTMIDKLEMGDLILRRIDRCGKIYHVGIYSGRKRVIEFTGNNNSSQCPKIRYDHLYL